MVSYIYKSTLKELTAGKWSSLILGTLKIDFKH